MTVYQEDLRELKDRVQRLTESLTDSEMTAAVENVMCVICGRKWLQWAPEHGWHVDDNCFSELSASVTRKLRAVSDECCEYLDPDEQCDVVALKTAALKFLNRDVYTEKLPKAFVAEHLGNTWERLEPKPRLKPGTKVTAKQVEVDVQCLIGTRIAKRDERARLLNLFKQRKPDIDTAEESA